MEETISILYRTKSRKKDRKEETLDKLHILINDLQEFKGKTIQRYPIVYSRIRIVENTQGLIDMIKGRIIRKKYKRRRRRTRCSGQSRQKIGNNIGTEDYYFRTRSRTV